MRIHGLFAIQAPVFCFALLACLDSAPADEARPRSDGGAGKGDGGSSVRDGGAPPDTAPPDTAPPEPTPTPFAFRLRGVEAPVAAQVLGSESASITVRGYPTAARVTARHAVLPLDFQGAFSPAFCIEVAARAVLAAKGGLGARFYRNYVRGLSDAALQVAISPIVGAEFEAALVAGARGAGATGPWFELTNPFVIAELGLDVELDADAISHIIGETASFATSLRRQLGGQLGHAAMMGIFAAAVVPKDFLCDLATGKARIVVRARGTAGGEVHETVTTSVGLEPVGGRR